MSEPITSTLISKWIVFSVWAAFGGITHALVEKRAGRVSSFWDGAVLAFISGFAGMMWGLVAIHYFGSDLPIIAFASGMGGFMSLEGLALIATYIKSKFLTEK